MTKKPDIALMVPDASPESLRFVARSLAIFRRLSNPKPSPSEPTEEEIQGGMDEARALVLAKGPAQA